MIQSFKNKTVCKKEDSRFVIGIVVITVGWLFLSFAPWQVWLKTNLWLKVGIAIAIFIVPGASLYLLNRRTDVKPRPIPFGFVLSHLLMALLGTAGRLFHFPFSYVKNIFMTLGMILIITNFLVRHTNSKRPETRNGIAAQLISYWPLAIILVLATLMTVQRVISSDDLAYLAHITNWQHMPALDFTDVYFDTDKVESSRFWIASTPFFQAFLAETSGVPGIILLSGYSEPYLVFIAIICLYDLARTLKLSHRSAMLAVAIQVTFLALLSDYLHPGAPFFHQLSTDKATTTFIFVPIFICSAIQLLEKANVETTLIFLLIGFSLSLTHPISSAFAAFIVGVLLLLDINRYTYKKHIALLLSAGIILSPQVAVRLIEHEAQFAIPNNINIIEQTKGIENQITRLGDSNFYGFNPKILEMRIPYSKYIPIQSELFSWVWIIIPVLSCLAAIREVKNNYLKQYILSATLLVALAGIPFTGWVLGYFVSAWMLERTTWFYPFGIGTVFLILTFRDNTKLGKRLCSWKLHHPKKIPVDFAFFARTFIWTASVLLILLIMREQGLPNITRLQNSTRRYQELSQIGSFIDERASQPVNVIGSDELNDFLPALAWKAKVISYRPEDIFYPYFYSEEEKAERLSDRQVVFSPQVSQDKQMEILQKYNIGFILLEKYKFGKVKGLISAYPTHFIIHSFGRYYLIEVRDISM